MGIKKVLPLVMVLSIMLLTVTSVSAKDVQVFNVDKAIAISYPKSEVHKLDESIRPQFRIFNKSSGKIIDNESAYCSLTIMNSSGYTIYYENSSYNTSSKFFYNDVNNSYFSSVGRYRYDILCEDREIDGFVSGQYDVTQSGYPYENINQNIDIGMIIMFFGVAVILLIIAYQIQNPAPKIFFILTSFVFIMGCLAGGYIVVFNSSLTTGLSSTVNIMMYAFGLVFFTTFAYVMIRQIQESLNLYRQNKGYEMSM